MKKDIQKAEEVTNFYSHEKKELKSVLNLKPWEGLCAHYNFINKTHLKELLLDEKRNEALWCRYEDIIFDFTHEKINIKTIDYFRELVEISDLSNKI